MTQARRPAGINRTQKSSVSWATPQPWPARASGGTRLTSALCAAGKYERSVTYHHKGDENTHQLTDVTAAHNSRNQHSTSSLVSQSGESASRGSMYVNKPTGTSVIVVGGKFTRNYIALCVECTEIGTNIGHYAHWVESRR